MQQNKGKVQNSKEVAMHPQVPHAVDPPQTVLQFGKRVCRWIAQYDQEVNIYAQ